MEIIFIHAVGAVALEFLGKRLRKMLEDLIAVLHRFPVIMERSRIGNLGFLIKSPCFKQPGFAFRTVVPGM
jgi:hypothetical protein